MQEAGDSNRLAIISAVAGKDEEAIKSKHVVVFWHAQGCDEVEEAKTHALRAVVNGHYSFLFSYARRRRYARKIRQESRRTKTAEKNGVEDIATNNEMMLEILQAALGVQSGSAPLFGATDNNGSQQIEGNRRDQ